MSAMLLNFKPTKYSLYLTAFLQQIVYKIDIPDDTIHQYVKMIFFEYSAFFLEPEVG